MKVNFWRRVLLWIDGLALIGLIVFSVLGALHQDTTAYVIGQIGCALVVLGSVLLLRRLRHAGPPDDGSAR